MATDVWSEVRGERSDLVAFLEGIEPEHWDFPSLCERWRVRDVVGHVVSLPHLTPAGMITGILRATFGVDRWLAEEGAGWGRLPPERLLGELRAIVSSRSKPPPVPAVAVLADVVVHHQDIRRPLGRPRQVPESRLRLALGHAVRAGGPLGTRTRVGGLRLVATDVDWSHGDGPEVRGGAEALLLAIHGRTVVLDELRGDGLAVLAGRLGVRQAA